MASQIEDYTREALIDCWSIVNDMKRTLDRLLIDLERSRED